MEWQPIKRWGGRYEVSADGKVRQSNGCVLKQWINTHGYMLVRLSQPRTVERVHRLVAESFITNAEGKPYVNHINNNRSDNRVENLEWCTQRENLEHAEKQGRMQRNFWVGKRSPNAVFSDDVVRAIRRQYSAGGISLERLGSKYGVSKRCIGRIVKGESYANVR